MPGKFEKKHIPTHLKRSAKLTDKQRAEIRENVDGLSQRALAERYGVSRRTIQFILDPEKLEENKKRRAERGGSKIYYDRETHTAAMRDHRRYKKRLDDASLLLDPDN
jgi:hypothetical protein